MELAKLLLIRLKIVLRYRLLLVVTIIHLLGCIIYVQNFQSLTEYSGEDYIINRYSEDDLFTYRTKNAIIYSVQKYKVGQLINYSGECIDNRQRNFIDFDYSKYLVSSNIKCSLYEPSIIAYEERNKFYVFKNNLRNKILKNDTLNFKRTIVFGDKSLVGDELDVFYNMHLSHLLALSGMHISLITLLLRYIISKFIEIKENVDIAVIIFITLYCLLIDYSYLVIRTFLILYISLFINQLNIKTSKLNIFLIVFNIVLIYNKFSVFSYSLIYSFLCYFIIMLVDYEKHKLIKLYLTITLFTIMITINLNNQINPIGLILSPFITVLFEVVYFPYLLITTVLMIPDYFTKYFIHFLDVLYVKDFNIIIGDINLFFVTFYYIFIYYLLTLKRRIDIFKVLLCIFVITFSIVIRSPKITVMFFDVGQGDAMLISLDNGVNILYDGGGNVFDEEKSDDIAKYTIIPYLKKQGIRRIDYIVASHGDIDHMGSFKYLIDNYSYKNIYINCDDENESEKLLNAEKLYNLEIKSANYNLSFNCTPSHDENESSIVLYARLFDTTLIALGDMGYDNEEVYAKAADILKVSHHGSNGSTSQELVDIVKPKYAIISVGKNSYGHPTKEVLNNLKNTNVYRTDTHGAIKIVISDKVVVETKLEN